MITLSLLNGQEIVVNAELIETLEPAHDTIVTLTTGRKFTVRETTAEITKRVIAYRREAYSAERITDGKSGTGAIFPENE